MLNRHNIGFYVSQNEETKAAVVERFNRTLKSKMWRYFTHENTYRYIDVLEDLLHSYNNSYHRTIGKTPASVKREDETALRERMYGSDTASAKPKFKVGDFVRISKSRHPFEKSYVGNWTEELFTVAEVMLTSPPTYRLKDYGGDAIEGSFYKEELQRVTKTDDIYKVEKVLKTRKVNGKRQFFVSWRGWPKKYNSWVDEDSLKTI